MLQGFDGKAARFIQMIEISGMLAERLSCATQKRGFRERHKRYALTSELDPKRDKHQQWRTEHAGGVLPKDVRAADTDCDFIDVQQTMRGKPKVRDQRAAPTQCRIDRCISQHGRGHNIDDPDIAQEMRVGRTCRFHRADKVIPAERVDQHVQPIAQRKHSHNAEQRLH